MGALTKTSQGRLEAFNRGSELPDDLRLLLKFIDGQRDAQDLQLALKPGVYSTDKLQKLIDLGLVQTASAIRLSPAANDTRHSAYLQTEPANLAEMTAPAVPEPRFTDSLSNNTKEDAADILYRARTSMETFVLTHAPQHAIQLLTEIENLSSLKQLQVSFQAYSLIISFTGVAGLAHLSELKHMIGEVEVQVPAQRMRP